MNFRGEYTGINFVNTGALRPSDTCGVVVEGVVVKVMATPGSAGVDRCRERQVCSLVPEAPIAPGWVWTLGVSSTTPRVSEHLPSTQGCTISSNHSDCVTIVRSGLGAELRCVLLYLVASMNRAKYPISRRPGH